MLSWRRLALAVSVASAAAAATAQTSVTTLLNPGFEVGAPGTAIGSPWMQIPGMGPMYVTTGAGLTAGTATSPHSGNFFITADRTADPSDLLSRNMGVFQDVDLSPYAGIIGVGGQRMELAFAYNDNDPNDTAVVSYSFLDNLNAQIGSPYTFNAGSAGTGNWALGSLLGDIPSNAAKMRVSLQTAFTGGTVRNISYDSLSATILPPPPPELATGIVHGNLIHFDGDGAWTWYSDERAIVDPNNGRVLVNSVGFSPTVTGSPAQIDVVNFDPATGRRVRTRLSNQVSGNPNIQNDDHNNGSLLVLPDGRYLAMYANHGNNGGLGDEFSRWRVSTNPGDSSSWTTEQLFNWYNNVPGANQTGNPDAANASYHNLFYLSAEDQVYNISRSYGRLSVNGASQNMPNIMRYDMATNTVAWAGQVLESEAQGYSAYPKYASNGVDKIYFTSTETHPRNYNNSIYAGYIQNGKTYDMLGNEIDPNLFDNGTVAGGSGFVPDVTDFTVVRAADALGAGHNRLWTVDMNLDAVGDPMALYISRWNPDGMTSDGSTTNPIDHRLHMARWNPTSQQWENKELARMGNRLYRGADLSEQDYTGDAALVPGDPNTVYVSTPYDPRDPSGGTFTTTYEIYKGVTADSGDTWSWTAITENSGVDNLRPIIPDSHGGETTVLWFRGTYTTAHSINAAVVGIVDRTSETLSSVRYFDATAANTTLASGLPLVTSPASASAGAADNLWHERTGFGNGGSVLTSRESGAENAPMLRTTLAGLDEGTYDVFAYFWSDNDEDWRIMAGLESNNLIDFRRYSSQHAEADQFESIETVSASNNDLLLYRAYLGRTTVEGDASVTAFIDDWSTSAGGVIRTWYDGLGVALVTPATLAGDFDGNGFVDGADVLTWQQHGVGSLEDWKANFGYEPPQGVGAAPEPGCAVLASIVVALRWRWRRGFAPVAVRSTHALHFGGPSRRG